MALKTMAVLQKDMCTVSCRQCGYYASIWHRDYKSRRTGERLSITRTENSLLRLRSDRVEKMKIENFPNRQCGDFFVLVKFG